MPTPVFIIRTTISTRLTRRALFKGALIALPGVIGWWLGAIFLSPPLLKGWGVGLFLVALALIAAGLLPYRRLSRKQLHPDSLISLDGKQLLYLYEGKPILTLPLRSIAATHYIDEGTVYGIAIRLHTPTSSPVVIHPPSQHATRLRKQGQRLGYDLFLPYFNKRGYEELVAKCRFE